MDEALKAKLAEEEAIAVTPLLLQTLIDNQKEAPVSNKLSSIKKWFILHPKVQAAFVALGLVVALNGDDAYNGIISWNEGVHRTVGAVFVAVIAYLKKSNGSTV